MIVDSKIKFTKLNLDTIEISEELKFANNHIRNIQENSTTTGNCYMSFYSIAKNIRYVSSNFFQNIKNGFKPTLANVCRPGEDHFWFNNTKESWYPWLWSRHTNNNNNPRESWSNFFELPDNSIESDGELKSSIDDLYLYLACLKHTFKLKETLKEHLINKYTDFDVNQDFIGLQIRRGELVPKNGSIEESWNNITASQYGGRPIYSIDEYMQGVKEISEKTGIINIYVSTDSEETIKYLNENYTEFNFFVSKYDRSKFIRYEGDPSTVALEFDVFRNQHLIEHYTDSCLIDLYLLSKCKAYVGGMVWSEYGLTGWFLQICEQQKITPYFNVEGVFETDGKQIKLLLI